MMTLPGYTNEGLTQLFEVCDRHPTWRVRLFALDPAGNPVTSKPIGLARRSLSVDLVDDVLRITEARPLAEDLNGMAWALATTLRRIEDNTDGPG
jgi:hypothetical protein